MPYENGKWSPDPEDAVYTDPNESKYIDEDGNDSRFGKYYSTGFVPDFPEIVKLKKSGVWAKLRPIERRWYHEDCTSKRLTKEQIQPILDIFWEPK